MKDMDFLHGIKWIYTKAWITDSIKFCDIQKRTRQGCTCVLSPLLFFEILADDLALILQVQYEWWYFLYKFTKIVYRKQLLIRNMSSWHQVALMKKTYFKIEEKMLFWLIWKLCCITIIMLRYGMQLRKMCSDGTNNNLFYKIYSFFLLFHFLYFYFYPCLPFLFSNFLFCFFIF